jgi:RNA polymerase sigma-70 factor (ECF subfamily)
MDASNETKQVTLLLRRWRDGDQESLATLIPLVKSELREIAHRYMRSERRGHILQTTALINEAYIRMVGQDKVEFENRTHFFAIAARLMRQVLVDYARRLRRAKRADGEDALSLDETLVISPARSTRLLELDEALERLGKVDVRKMQVVELRYFGGMSVEESAQVLQVSPNTVIRDWALAKAWLKRELENSVRDER